MNDQELREHLVQLHLELERATQPEERDILGHLMTDIVRISQGVQLDSKARENLNEQLEHRASDFELRHPRVAHIVQEIIEVLSRLGI